MNRINDIENLPDKKIKKILESLKILENSYSSSIELVEDLNKVVDLKLPDNVVSNLKDDCLAFKKTIKTLEK